MRISCRTFATALLLSVFGTLAVGQEDLELVRNVADNYQRLSSFEFTGHLTTAIPGTAFQLRTHTYDAEAGPSFLPKHSPLLKYGETLRFHGGAVIDSDGKPAPPEAIGNGVSMPTHWGRYQNLASEILSLNSLPSETLKLQGRLVACRVVEVVYDRKRWKPEERTIKYWIDAKRQLVLKQEFAEWQKQDSDDVLWNWSYTVDSIALSQRPPSWLISASKEQMDRPEPRLEWIGRTAPDFNLLDLSGRPVHSSDLRGKVVFLDFWATWCGPCIDEIPAVMRLASEYKSSGLETWTVSDEPTSDIQQSLSGNGWALPVLVDSGRRFTDQFQVVGLPSLILIGRDGKVFSYFTGKLSEQSLRAQIESALAH